MNPVIAANFSVMRYGAKYKRFQGKRKLNPRFRILRRHGGPPAASAEMPYDPIVRNIDLAPPDPRPQRGPAILEKAAMIEVTPNAAGKIRGMIENDNPGGLLRLGVIGGGCSGLQYKFRYETRPRANDNVFEVAGARLCVDPKSFQYLDGMTLDYTETLLEQRFLFKNPNAGKSCGCGKSFQV